MPWCRFSSSMTAASSVAILIWMSWSSVQQLDPDDNTASFSWSAPGFLFFGRVVVLHGAPKDLPALGDQDFTICVQQFDVRHRSIVEHGCFLFLERRPPCP